MILFLSYMGIVIIWIVNFNQWSFNQWSSRGEEIKKKKKTDALLVFLWYVIYLFLGPPLFLMSYQGRAVMAGSYLVPKMVMYPIPCFYKCMQSTSYEAVVQGSYVPSADASQKTEAKVLALWKIIDYLLERNNELQSSFCFSFDFSRIHHICLV